MPTDPAHRNRWLSNFLAHRDCWLRIWSFIYLPGSLLATLSTLHVDPPIFDNLSNSPCKLLSPMRLNGLPPPAASCTDGSQYTTLEIPSFPLFNSACPKFQKCQLRAQR